MSKNWKIHLEIIKSAVNSKIKRGLIIDVNKNPSVKPIIMIILYDLVDFLCIYNLFGRFLLVGRRKPLT